MRRNPERTASRRKEIITAAKDLFFEYGYDATSIRMIQERVGKQVAVFYYYFESKDEVFDYAIDMFLKTYEDQLKELMGSERVSPIDDLQRILNYVEEQTRAVHAQYGNTLHWSVISGIQTRALQLVTKYIRQLLGGYVDAGKVAVNVMGLDETCSILAYALGGAALYQDDNYAQQRIELRKLIPTLITVYEG